MMYLQGLSCSTQNGEFSVNAGFKIKIPELWETPGNNKIDLLIDSVINVTLMRATLCASLQPFCEYLSEHTSYGLKRY